MLTKNQIKIFKQLHQKKYRLLHQQFIVEGEKNISEFLASNLVCEYILHLKKQTHFKNHTKALEISEDELQKISTLQNANDCLAIFQMKKIQNEIKSDLILVLDQINNPGNLGTIIRLCDWFGVEDIVCSEDTVDVYNPKVIQATMGSFSRVNVHYKSLVTFLKSTHLPIYGTFMTGTSIYEKKIDKGCLIMGNEANGVSEEVAQLVHEKITIPQFGKIKKTESLNVTVATTIFLNEIFRNKN